MDDQMKDTLQSINATLQSFDRTLKQMVQTLDKLYATWKSEQTQAFYEKHGMSGSF